LHFPKIDVLPPQDVVSAVSLAGASELAHEVGEEEEVSVVRDQSSEVQAEEIEEEGEIQEEESNVVAVDPANLGFKKDVDVLEETETPKRKFTIPKIPKIPNITIPKAPIVAVAAGILVLIGFLNWFVPHATVTILTAPKALTATETLTIDSTATSVDAQKKIIPGYSQEKSVSGTKTIPVTGKKDVGDPAKGPVTIYNKTTSSKTFVKGAVLSAGSLQFTLDAEVQVASASESVGSLTFGKATGAITASQIGTDSNLVASTEFHFKDSNADVAIARNDAALTGGTSKSVTVVSRADQDAFVKAVSADLVDKAKADFAQSVTGGQKLIDETIKTAVTQKTFNQELDQEAKELSGSATVTVSGVSYGEDDVKILMKAMITGQIPTGYALAEGRTKVTIENVKVGKTGAITAKTTIASDAIPTLDVKDIQSKLGGKTISAAQEYLKNLTGVAGVEIRFGLSFTKSRLPFNAKNITVSIAIK